MSPESINAICWALIAVIWAFVLIGGWRTLNELRVAFQERRNASSVEQLAASRPARLFGMVWG